MADSWLSNFSDVLEAQRLSREEHRKAFSAELEKRGPVVFIPLDDAPGHGIGWFRGDVGFVAYRKYSNGYDVNRIDQLEDELLKKLLPHMPG